MGLIALKRYIYWFILICFTCEFYTTSLLASPDYWPTNGWRSSAPEKQGIDSRKLIEMMEFVRDGNHAINNISIIRNGYMVLDAYRYPFQKNIKHVIHSVTKSITSALVGIALDKGYIKNVHQPVLAFFPEKTFTNLNEQKRTINLEHLLTMASGLGTKDSYLYNWVGIDEMRIREDWAQYVLDLPMTHAPGKHFEYSNGGSYLLSAIIQKATKMSAFEFAEKHLFGPLGIADVKWPSNRQGVNFGWGGMRLRPHDMAKFGLLYLNKGRWGNQQLVSETWVRASTRKHLSATLFDGYGYQWWIDTTQYYMAVGYLGQFIFVVPEKNIVVTFTSNLERNHFNFPKRLLDQFIIPAAVTSKPLVARPKNKEKLDILLANFARAPAQGFIWALGKTGVAKNGEFHHTASPAFRFKYPKTSQKRARRSYLQVMAMKTLRGGDFSASIREVPVSTKLAEVGSKVFVGFLQNFGSNVQVVSNKQIKLKDSTIAYKTEIRWKQASTPLVTLLVSALKDNKCVFLHYTFVAWDESSNSESLKEGTSIIESLTFDNL